MDSDETWVRDDTHRKRISVSYLAMNLCLNFSYTIYFEIYDWVILIFPTVKNHEEIYLRRRLYREQVQYNAVQ